MICPAPAFVLPRPKAFAEQDGAILVNISACIVPRANTLFEGLDPSDPDKCLDEIEFGFPFARQHHTCEMGSGNPNPGHRADRDHSVVLCR